MEIDENKVDEAALALLSLTMHDVRSVWKQIDWDAMNRLHEKGYISNPISKSKSVMLTDEGIKAADALVKKLFSK
jgi:hypothetical protein